MALGVGTDLGCLRNGRQVYCNTYVQVNIQKGGFGVCKLTLSFLLKLPEQNLSAEIKDLTLLHVTVDQNQ